MKRKVPLAIKRLIDVVGAALGIVLLLPVLIVIAFFIWLKMGFPIFFKQERVGYCGRPFVIYKFRTMMEKYDANGNLLPDEERLTPLGRFLRRTSLDELPELFNILKGDMSFVGPRPLPVEYLGRYTTEQFRRHSVKPGLTGWAQVNGRNAITWDKKFKYDLWYVDNWNLLLDFKILLLTIVRVITGEGINHEGYSTMPEFKGDVTD
ncbi:MAG: sugar transferase [Gammaproteobacteria bacterium]|nr:sugar transferase [Gammaproteobacteria bacterium]